MLEPLFNEVASLKGCSFMKKRLQQKCFLLSRFLYGTSRWLLLVIRQIKDQARKGEKCWENIKKKRFYSCINIYFCSWHRRVTRGGRWGGLPCPFLKIGKKYPNLEKKCPACGQLYVKFVI